MVVSRLLYIARRRRLLKRNDKNIINHVITTARVLHNIFKIHHKHFNDACMASYMQTLWHRVDSLAHVSTQSTASYSCNNQCVNDLELIAIGTQLPSTAPNLCGGTPNFIHHSPAI